MKPARTGWPWISLVLSGAAVLSPWGRDILWSAFLSDEQLSRNIARPIALAGAGILLLVIASEYLLRRFLIRK